MGFSRVRKLRIGYWPLSQTLLAAGDRRRLISWANARGHEIVQDIHQKVDVIVASENSDFNSRFFTQKSTPIIFDLVDAIHIYNKVTTIQILNAIKSTDV